MGEKGKLTIGKMYQIFGEGEEKKAIDEICRLRLIDLIIPDKATMDEKGMPYEETKLLWLPKKGDEMPLDPGPLIHDPVADFMSEQQVQFISNFKNCVCQRCGEKNEEIFCINLECDMKEDKEYNVEYVASPWDMIAICEKCRNELRKWLNIPIQDPLED